MRKFTNKGDFMYKKLTTLVLAVAALVIFLPSQSSAAVSNEKTATTSENSASNSLTPQRDWRNRRWNRNRRMNNRRMNNRRVRVIRQVYYRNGRRYVRIVRVRY
jgi:hypothetical protein